jgi:hypothetical protein
VDLTPAETLLTEAGQGWQEHQPEVVDADCPSCDTGYCRPHHVVSCAECGDDWPCYTIRAYQAGREDAARPMIDPADVRIVLDQRIGHDHQRPGVWDFDNLPDRAGQPCVECAARKRLRAAIEADQPRTVEEAVGDNPEEQRP